VTPPISRPKPPPLTRNKEEPAKADPISADEMREILNEIARNPSNRSAQIQALRFLKELDEGSEPPAQGFEALDRIRRKAA
jgi:hypothetical protein